MHVYRCNIYNEVICDINIHSLEETEPIYVGILLVLIQPMSAAEADILPEKKVVLHVPDSKILGHPE